MKMNITKKIGIFALVFAMFFTMVAPSVPCKAATVINTSSITCQRKA